MKIGKIQTVLTLMTVVLLGTSWLKADEPIPVVENFELDRFLGKWYEIARLPHSFEEGLEQVTATYSLRDDGKVKVLNRGYDIEDQEWSEAEGKARIADPEMPAYLEVSFFWIFYADYRIIELEPDYQYMMVTSSSRDYLWILSRTPNLDQNIYLNLVEKAKNWGFDTSKLIMVKHNREEI